MKKNILLIIVVLLFSISCSDLLVEFPFEPVRGPLYFPALSSVNADISYFYGYLSYYGSWVELAPYGYVWIPANRGYRWRPYLEGQWLYTDFGWTWKSNLEWGEIPFHYGRWAYDSNLGWFWVPGVLWGPAWVAWRQSEDYIGWAPIPPGDRFDTERYFNLRASDFPVSSWVFVEVDRFQERNIAYYALPIERNRTLVNFTQFNLNIRYSGQRIFQEGVGLQDIGRLTRRNVPVYGVMENPQPGLASVQNNQFRLFKPAINNSNSVRPNVYLNRIEAARSLPHAPIWDALGSLAPEDEQAFIKRKQREEISLLKESQNDEIDSLNRRYDTLIRQAVAPGRKLELENERKQKLEELKRQHQIELQEISDRHKRDLEHIAQAHSAGESL